MKTYGIIAEYNPFHNGHLYHIEETKRRTGSDAIVAVMSGNFVQRGEPALTDKWIRAEAAVRCGVDLVLELPVVYACSSAEHFAFGGVGALNSLGILEGISFGVEDDSPDELLRVGKLLAEEPPAYREALRRALSDGLPYAAARSRGVAAVLEPEAEKLLNQPNNILAVEYLKQLQRRSSPLTPLMIPRKSALYDSVNFREEIAGAGWIREMIRGGVELKELSEVYPAGLQDLYAEAPMVLPEGLFPLILYALRSGEGLGAIDGVTEGLENRAARVALSASSMEELLTGIKSKRYSRTAVQRMLMRILLKITKEDMAAFEASDRYALRVLGFSDRGAALIREISRQKDPKTMLITNPNRQKPEDPLLKKMRHYDSLAADLYDLSRNGRMGECAEYKMVPFRL